MDDIRARLKDVHELMAEGFKELRRIAKELSSERGLGSDDFASYMSEDRETEEEQPNYALMGEVEAGGVPESEALDAYSSSPSYEEECSDFPGRPFFDPKTVNWDDPAFAGGVSLGIPVAVVVRSHDGQDKLLPIKDGRFVDERKRT